MRSCLHGINLQPVIVPRVAAFDLDGTIIKSQFGNATTTEWQWWRSNIPAKLKEVHEAGYAIVIISNQAIKDVALNKWKQKITSIAEALGEVPFRLLAATAKDRYRKPMPGMWCELERMFCEGGIEIDCIVLRWRCCWSSVHEEQGGFCKHRSQMGA
jgi:bifunctional polynucleotide phosphatase/kinase